MSNLRDRGYPSSRSQSIVHAYQDNAVDRPNREGGVYVGPIDYGYNPVEPAPSAMDKFISAYNNYAFGNGAPMIRKFGTDYVDDNDERGYQTGLALDAVASSPGSRLGYVKKDVNSMGTTYGAGIDFLNPFLGDRYYDNTIETPLGNIGYGYEDGTLYGTVDVPSNKYYIAALRNLLTGRGSL